MDKLFSLNEFNQKLEQTQAEDKSEIARLKFLSVHEQKVENLKNLNGRLPDPGELFFLWSLNSFNAFTFIVYVIKNIGRIDELTLSTYSINQRILTSLVKWYDKGQISKIDIFIADSIKTRVPKIADQLQLFSETRNIDVKFAWNHSKITLMTAKDHHFVVEGSGNFSENAAHEQYIFTDDERLYNFRKSCLSFAS